MNLPPLKSDAECDPGPYFKAVARAVTRHLSQCVVLDRRAYVAVAQSAQELFFPFFSVLHKRPAAQHQTLWLAILKDLVEWSHLVVSEHADADLRSDHFGSATVTYADIFRMLSEYVERYVASIDLCWFAGAGAPLQGALYDFYTLVLDFYSDGECMFRWPVDTDAVASKIAGGLGAQEQCLAPAVALLRMAYTYGCTLCVEAAFFGEEAVLHERFPQACGELKKEFVELVSDYYVYGAFCLTRLASSGAQIDQRAADLADVFYTVAFALPTASVAQFAKDDGETATAHKRRERLALLLPVKRLVLAFHYLVNYLLRAKSAHEIVAPHPKVLAELTYLESVLGRGAAHDLDALATQSRSSSVISMQRLELTFDAGQPRAHTMAAILEYGSYMEKVKMVIPFFKMIFRGQIGTVLADCNIKETCESDFYMLVARMNTESFPGKLAFVAAVDKIVRLLHLLVARRVASAGLKSDLEPVLRHFGCAYTPEEVEGVKRLQVLMTVQTQARAVEMTRRIELLLLQLV